MFKSKDKVASANKKVADDGAMKPSTVVGLPEVDPGWQERAKEVGLQSEPPPPVTPQNILRPRSTRKDTGDGHELWGQGLACDRRLAQDDWMRVYEAYQHVGTPAGLIKVTGLKEREVRHLLDYGVRRLSLPAIKEHAIDLAEVNKRIKDMGGDGVGSKATKDNFKFNLPEVQEAVTERVAKEAAGAQLLLNSAMAAASLYESFLSDLKGVVDSPNGGFALPEKVGPKLLKDVISTGDKLATALDRAVRLSRLTAGEPESNVGLEVAIMVNRLDRVALQEFGETGRVPPELRGRISAGRVIDAEATIKEPEDD